MFLKVIQLNGEDGWAYHNLALTYTRQEKYSEAVPLFLKSIDLFAEEKDKAVSWNQLANVYRLLNDYDNAIAAYQIADTLDPRIRASRNKNSQDRPVTKVNTDKQISSSDAAEGQIRQCRVWFTGNIGKWFEARSKKRFLHVGAGGGTIHSNPDVDLPSRKTKVNIKMLH